jgi:hypothetical protein
MMKFKMQKQHPKAIKNVAMGIPCDDIITQPDTQLIRRSLTPNDYGGTSVIHKHQIMKNTPQLLHYVYIS